MAVEASHSWRDSYKGMSSDNINGLVLALSSSFFIGASFIVKKKGLMKAAASGVRAGVGGYSYLYEPLWWVGMISIFAKEYYESAITALAPFCFPATPCFDAILLTLHNHHTISHSTSANTVINLLQLPAIITFGYDSSAALAHVILGEKLHIFGILGCALCVVGSTTIVLHAPQERAIESVTEVWDLATEPGFLLYAAMVLTAVFIIIFHYIPQYGQTHIMVYIGVCSLVGSLSALDTFSTAVVSPIYYVMFTSFTILASVIMFKDWDRQSPTQIVTEMCGFVTILSGTFLLHKTKDMVDGLSMSPSIRLHRHTDEEDGFGMEGIPLRRQETSRSI
ncbi:hypothetical protein TEA_016399 [Camellia sinensis var. sinensis]|uniref:Probable magnesium transporter n=1 Tax=Camellia sinensis var. sinensis TaxID=542762 RepID=A0A4S4DLV0_CAMSN|nr:hypothetical protein TEA_016399 [Camellia sinensis var. sinensis]